MSDAMSRMLAWSEFSGTVRDSLRYTVNRAAAATTNPAASSQRRRRTYRRDGVLADPAASPDGGLGLSVSVPGRSTLMEPGV